MNRRGFLTAVAAIAATAVLDPERALWIPGKKLISIPRPLPACTSGSGGGAGQLPYPPGDVVTFSADYAAPGILRKYVVMAAGKSFIHVRDRYPSDPARLSFVYWHRSEGRMRHPVRLGHPLLFFTPAPRTSSAGVVTAPQKHGVPTVPTGGFPGGGEGQGKRHERIAWKQHTFILAAEYRSTSVPAGWP